MVSLSKILHTQPLSSMMTTNNNIMLLCMLKETIGQCPFDIRSYFLMIILSIMIPIQISLNCILLFLKTKEYNSRQCGNTLHLVRQESQIYGILTKNIIYINWKSKIIILLFTILPRIDTAA